MELEGIIEEIMETQVISEKFQKRDFVLLTGRAEFPQYVLIQVVKDKCPTLDSYKHGDAVKVSININGKKWNGPNGIKYFVTIEAWKIEKQS